MDNKIYLTIQVCREAVYGGKLDTKGRGSRFVVWDSEGSNDDPAVTGFGLRVYPESEKKSFVFSYRFDGAKRMIRLGNFPNLTVKAARKIARECRNKVHSGIDPRPKKQERTVEFSIEDALRLSSESRDWTPNTIKAQEGYCRAFLEWCRENKLKNWSDISYQTVLKYKKSLIDKKMAFDSIRLYFQPVRIASRWAHNLHPDIYRDVSLNLRIKSSEIYSTEYNEKSGNPFLTFHEVLDFIEFILCREEDTVELRYQLALGVALQGLCGLSLQEAYRLTGEKHFDGFVVIDGQVKNQYRIRKIPIPRLVSVLLEKTKPTKKSERFIQYSSFKEYGKAISRRLKAWNPDKGLKPKDLRNTLQTEAIDGNWYGFYVQRFVGHRPATIGEQRYYGDRDRLPALLAENILPRIEAAISSWNPPQNSRLEPLINPLKLVINR